MEWNFEYLPVTDSTNTELFRRASCGAVPGTVLWTRCQTAGKGSRGRSFFSPDTGLYFSALLAETDPLTVTPTAALAAAAACESVADVTAKIKWVNDIYVDGKKVCGILAETMWQGNTPLTILGVGVNLGAPTGGFPTDLRHPATFLLPKADDKTAEKFLHAFFSAWDGIDRNTFADEYRKRSFCIGKSVTLVDGEKTVSGTVIDTDQTAALLIRLPDGTVYRAASGEINIVKKS